MTQKQRKDRYLTFEEMSDGYWPQTSGEHSIGSEEPSAYICHRQKPGRRVSAIQKRLWRIQTLQCVTIYRGVRHVTHQTCHQHVGGCDSKDFDPTKYTSRFPVAFVVQEVTPTKPQHTPADVQQQYDISPQC